MGNSRWVVSRLAPSCTERLVYHADQEGREAVPAQRPVTRFDPARLAPLHVELDHPDQRLSERWLRSNSLVENCLLKLKLTRFRGARQAFNGGFSDAQDASALFT
jgi:hypothetical protein